MYPLPRDIAPPCFVRQRSKSTPPIRGGDATPRLMFRSQSIHMPPVSSGLRWDNASNPKSSMMPRRPKRTFDEAKRPESATVDHSRGTARSLTTEHFSAPTLAPPPPRFVRRKTPDSDWIVLALCGNERVMEDLNRPPRSACRHPTRFSVTGAAGAAFTRHTASKDQSNLQQPQLFWFM